MIKYLESRTWVKQLRNAADANKALLIVDPMTFSKGVADKKNLVYERYSKILREITKLIKVNELHSWDKHYSISYNLYSELTEICKQV